ncbi:MAG: hypothetical protein IJJ51_03345 [Kiritimatiellae bacterium]|nr:hypothetical protein [Kiritimatiellia bacterium]
MKTTILAAAAFLAIAAPAQSKSAPVAPDGVEFEDAETSVSFNAGAGLRVRQEIMHNVPAAEFGVLGRQGVKRGKTKNQFRFRPDVWMEVKFGGNWRLFARVVDEFRYGVVQRTKNQEWPCEAVVDNLYIEGKGLFDDFLDVRIGRQDLYSLYGLNHIFVDGTPGDGSCSTYANMANFALHFDERSWLDLFALYCMDQEELRWGSSRSRHLSKTGFGRGEREMDDLGYGAVWNSSVGLLDYKLFYIHKDTMSFRRDGVKHPHRSVNLLGTKLVPRWTEEFSTPLELMGQVGSNSDHDTLSGWAAYAGFDWRKSTESTFKPYWNGGLLVLSGDKDAADEDGGHGAWDPMWYRGVDDSEMFLYGSMYGCGWWSNMVNLKTTAGMEFGYRHKAQVMFGPMWAQERDGIGGGDGRFKGFLTQVRYDFPLYIADKGEGGRLEVFGHAIAEFFNPGDYFDTDKPAYFFRWQIDFRF